MRNLIIAIDQSTSATKAMLFDEECHLLAQHHIPHQQFYPNTGWVEHDAEEIYQNTIEAIRFLLKDINRENANFSLAITNQRETAIVWDRRSGKPISHAVVWQDTRGAALCRQLRQDESIAETVMEKSGLLIDPNFSASGVAWLLDNIEGARESAEQGNLLMGTIDTWLIWKLTEGSVFATDTTNASRTMLFNIHTLQWDEDLLKFFRIPRSMMAEVRACDATYGTTTVEGLFATPILIAGVLGDSHGALIGQACFSEGSGKATYGTGSSVMVNIGQIPLPPPKGLVTSVGFTALGKTFYGYEGNIYSTGATLKWIADQLKMVGAPNEMEKEATSVPDNGGVYIVPAFSGLGAPWWKMDVKGAVFGLTFATNRAHFLRAALESIAYQIKDLTDVMVQAIGGKLHELCADGGPTRNKFLMQWQADLLNTPLVCTEVEDASAMGAVIVNGLARKTWTSFEEIVSLRKVTRVFRPSGNRLPARCHQEWLSVVGQLTGSR